MRLYLDEMAELYKDEIIEYVDHQILHNCNLNGMKYEIIHSDFTYIENCDEIDAVNLLEGIYAIMAGETNEIC